MMAGQPLPLELLLISPPIFPTFQLFDPSSFLSLFCFFNLNVFMLVNWAEDSLKREPRSKVRHADIQASKVCVICFLSFTLIWSSCHFMSFSLLLLVVANIIHTILGPRPMLKMLLDAQGGFFFFFYPFSFNCWMTIWICFCISVASDNILSLFNCFK